MSKAFLMGLNAGRVEEGEEEFDIKELAKHIDGSSTEFIIDGSWGITEIKPYCFYNSLLETLKITPITKIGNYAFYNGSELTDFVFNPNILKEVGAYAFYDCKKAFLGKEEDVSFEVNLETVGNYAFHNFALNGKVFDIDFKKKCDFGEYAFRYAKIKKLKGSLGDIGQYAFANLGRTAEEIDVKIEGSVGTYAFSNNNTALVKIDKNSNITSLGTYAFYNFGANRSNPSSNRITLDLRNSVFSSIGTYAFAGSSSAVANKPKYYDLYLPATVTTINTYAFRYNDNFRLILNSVPTLSNVNAFESATNYKIYVPYEIAEFFKAQTNWSNTTIKNNTLGYALGSEFGLNEDLPTHNKITGVPITWYSDESLTTSVTKVTDENAFYFTVESGVREMWYLEINTTDTDVVIYNSDLDINYTKSALVPLNNTLELISATPKEDYFVALLILNGQNVLPTDSWVMDEDYIIKSISTNQPMNLNFQTATPEEIQLVSLVGMANEYPLGATRQITLKDSTNITLRIVDNTGNIIHRSDNSYAGLVLEFVEQMPTTAQMNISNTNAGGWDGSNMHNVTMGSVLDLLPDDWQNIIASAKIQTMDGGSQSGVALKTSIDKLWLPAEREIFASRSYSHIDEWNALTRFALYDLPANDNATFRIKQRAGSNAFWWLRSAYSSGSAYFVYVNASGNVNYYGAYDSYGVAPCFAI